MADTAANRAHGSPTMGLHPSEQRMLRRIEEHLRTKDRDLDAFLSGRSALRRPRVLLGAMYLVPPVFIALGLVLHIIVLVVVGVVAAVTYLVQGNRAGDLASVRASGFILLFAFTYLWVAANQFLNAGGRAFGWYCLFVAITAIPAGIYTLQAADGNTAVIWLGIDWFAWAVLWALFWALLALGRPIALFTGWVTILVGVGTSWVFAIAILEGKVTF